jgi:prevent-host-death family protein
MQQTTISSRELNQDATAATRAALNGPVIVTDGGEPAFVLMTHAEFRRLTGAGRKNIVELLADPESPDIEFDPPKLGNDLVRAADLG